MHQFCTACQSQGWGITKFCAALRRAFANPGATPKLLAIRGFPSEYNYTEELHLNYFTCEHSVGCSWINQRGGGSYEGYNNITDCHVNIHASFY